VFIKKFYKDSRRKGPPEGCVVGSVFVQQKKGRHAAIGFQDDPELHTRAERVCGQQTPTVLEAKLVFAAVGLVNIAPIAGEVAHEIGERVIPGCLECFQNTRSGYDRAGRELDPAPFTTLRMPWFRQ